MNTNESAVLVHLASGIGNIVLATPLLVALNELGLTVDVWLSADYPQTADLLRPWNVVRQIFSGPSPPAMQQYAHVIPATPPFYWPRFAARFASLKNLVPRPRARLFYQEEQDFYLDFARHLGTSPDRHPFCTLPIVADETYGVISSTVVLAPGCKTGEMTAKRWPHFSELAEAFADVVIVGTEDDWRRSDGRCLRFPDHARSFVGQLTLRQTAELMAGAGVVVANDSGLAHIAAAVGAPTIIIFGPTPHQTLGQFPPNVTILRQGLACEPCWFGQRFRACARRITCLEALNVEIVVEKIQRIGISGILAGRRGLRQSPESTRSPNRCFVFT